MQAKYRENRFIKRLKQTWRENILPQLDRWAIHLNAILPHEERELIDGSDVMQNHVKAVEHQQNLRQWKKDKQIAAKKTAGEEGEPKKSYTPSLLPLHSPKVEYNPNILAPIRQSFIYSPTGRYRPPPEYDNLRTSNYYTDEQRKLQEYMIRKRYDINTYTNPDGTKRPLSNDRLDRRYLTDVLRHHEERNERRRKGWLYQWYHRLVDPYIYHPVYHPRSNSIDYREPEDGGALKPSTHPDEVERMYDYTRLLTPPSAKEIQQTLGVKPETIGNMAQQSHRPSYKSLLTPTEIDDHQGSKYNQGVGRDGVSNLSEPALRAQEEIRNNIAEYTDARDYLLKQTGRYDTYNAQRREGRDTRSPHQSSPWDGEFNEWFMPVYDWGGLFG